MAVDYIGGIAARTSTNNDVASWGGADVSTRPAVRALQAARVRSHQVGVAEGVPRATGRSNPDAERLSVLAVS